MTYVVTISLHAVRDADRLGAWLTTRNPHAAFRLGSQLEQAIVELAQYPLRGRPVGPTTRELLLPFGQGAYIVRYRVKGQSVIITRIWHGLEQR